MSTTKLQVSYAITWSDPNIVITYAETYGSESYEGDDLICVAAPGTDHLVNIGSGDTLTTVDWRKETTLGSASRSAFITAVLALVQVGAATPDNHYIITTKDEFDTAITDATAAAVPYRFEIAAGTYAFTVLTDFPANGEITGAGQNVTIITSTAVQSNAAAFDIGSNSTVRDLTFNYLDNGSLGNLFRFTPSADSYNRIVNCRFTRFDGIAVDILTAGSGSVTEITNCLFDEPHTSGNDTGVYVNGTSTGASVQVTGCTFKGSDYGYYCDGAGATEKITDCLFDSNVTNPFYTTSNTARSINVSDNDFRDCAGDIIFPTSTTSVADLYFGGNTFDNFSGTRPLQIGESTSSHYTGANIAYTGNLTEAITKLNDIYPGTYRISYSNVGLSDVGSQSSVAVVTSSKTPADDDGTGWNVNLAEFTNVLVDPQAISTNNAATTYNISNEFVVTLTALTDLYLVVGNRVASTATAVSVDITSGIAPSPDNGPVLLAQRIK